MNKADRPGADRLRNELELMLGLRDGSTLKNVPAHHGVDLSRPMTTDEKLAMNPGRAARAAAKRSAPTVDAARASFRCNKGRRDHRGRRRARPALRLS